MLELEDHPPNTFMEELRSIHALSTYVIPPISEAVIPARVHGTVPPGTIGLAERYRLQGAAAFVKVAEGEMVPFRLINPTSKPNTFYKGASLGTFSEADGDPDFYPVGDSSPMQPLRQEPDKVPVDLQSSSLDLAQQERLKALLNEYRDIFAVTPGELGRTNLVQHHIDTGDHRPIRHPPELVDKPYLTEEDFPADSFLVEHQEVIPESQDSDRASIPDATNGEP